MIPNLKTRLSVAAFAIALLALLGFTNPSMATALTFPAIMAVLMAPELEKQYKDSPMDVTVMSLGLIALGLALAFINPAMPAFAAVLGLSAQPGITLTAITLGAILPIATKLVEGISRQAKVAMRQGTKRLTRTNTQRRRDARNKKK